MWLPVDDNSTTYHNCLLQQVTASTAPSLLAKPAELKPTDPHHTHNQNVTVHNQLPSLSAHKRIVPSQPPCQVSCPIPYGTVKASETRTSVAASGCLFACRPAWLAKQLRQVLHGLTVSRYLCMQSGVLAADTDQAICVEAKERCSITR
jgi:hypothetical protein